MDRVAALSYPSFFEEQDDEEIRDALPDDAARNGSLPAGTVTVEVRPEHVNLTPEAPSLALPMVVSLIEPVGAESYVHLR